MSPILPDPTSRNLRLAPFLASPRPWLRPGLPPSGNPSQVAPPADEAALRAAVTRARAAQSAWSVLDPAFRFAPFQRLGDLLATHQDSIAQVLPTAADDEFDAAAQARALEAVAALIGEYRTVLTGARKALRPIRVRHGLRTATVAVLDAVGIVGLVPGSGFDLLPAVAALLAGNSLVVLAEGDDNRGAFLLTRLLIAARLPKDLVQVIAGPIGIADTAIGQVDLLLLTASDERSQQLATLVTQADCRLTVGSVGDVASFTTCRRITPA